MLLHSATTTARLAVYTGTLSDTAGHWAESLVAYAQKIGVIKGDTEGTFRPANREL